MGTDSRIKDLAEEIISTELSALLSTMYLAVDADSFTDAQKVKWSSLITNAAVLNNTNNYQAMTPKAFYDSVMTTTANGVNRRATGTEVTNKSGSGVLVSSDQAAMQTQWLKDIFVGSDLPNYNYYKGNYSQGFTTIIYEDQILANGYVQINPVLEEGKTIAVAVVTLAFASNNHVQLGSYAIPVYTSGGEQSIVLNSKLHLRISSDRKIMKLVPQVDMTYVRGSATVNLIIE